MADKQFKQDEINRIVASRLKRERDRMTREFENTLKRCMAAIHLMLHQEMCSMKQDMAAETKDALLSGSSEMRSSEQPGTSCFKNPAESKETAGR